MPLLTTPAQAETHEVRCIWRGENVQVGHVTHVIHDLGFTMVWEDGFVRSYHTVSNNVFRDDLGDVWTFSPAYVFQRDGIQLTHIETGHDVTCYKV